MFNIQHSTFNIIRKKRQKEICVSVVRLAKRSCEIIRMHYSWKGFLCVALINEACAFAPNYRHGKVALVSLKSSEAAFSAFAESLEEEDLIDEKDYGTAKTRTWQESVESLLDPTSSFTKKQILLSELLSQNEKIRSDVESALRDRTVCSAFFTLLNYL